MATTTNNNWTTPDDSDPFRNGALAIRTLGNGIDTSTGKGLLAWQAYTPTLSGLSLGTGGTRVFSYCQIGKTVHVKGVITLGTGFSFSGGAVDIGTPVNSTGYVLGLSTGTAMFFNGANYFYGTNISIGNPANFRVIATVASGTYAYNADIISTVPFTWAAGHKIFVTYTYEAA